MTLVFAFEVDALCLLLPLVPAGFGEPPSGLQILVHAMAVGEAELARCRLRSRGASGRGRKWGVGALPLQVSSSFPVSAVSCRPAHRPTGQGENGGQCIRSGVMRTHL